MKLKILGTLIMGSALVCGCIKPPDDNMTLGDETPADNIQKALDDAQSGITVEKSFHVGDSGLKATYQTAFTSTQVVSDYRWTVTSSDANYFYIESVNLKDANPQTGTTQYKLAKSSSVQSSTPSFALHLKGHSPSENFVSRFKKKICDLFAKITIRPSTAVGEDLQSSKIKLITPSELLEASRGVSPLDSDTETHRYFGLKVSSHLFSTSAYKANATHIEYNDLDTKDGQTKQVHMAIEISKEVPGLFTVLSYCGSWVEMKGNVQIPVLVCESVDDFKMGTN